MNKVSDKVIKKSLWISRLIIAVLIFFIFINRGEVVGRYNSSAWWGILSASLIAWLVAEWSLSRIHASDKARHALLAIGATALYADSFGTMAHFYDDHHWYDWPMHFLGTAAITLWLWYILRTMLHKQKIELPLTWYMWLVFTTAIFFGNIFEFLEYTADLLFVEGNYWIGAAPDTVEDILMNALGAGTVVLFMGWLEKRKKI